MSRIERGKPGAAGGDAPLVPYFLSADAAERHGIDLARALQDGLVTCEDLREVFEHCRDCTDGAGLRHGDDRAEATARAPDWCANKDVLDGLRGLLPRRG